MKFLLYFSDFIVPFTMFYIIVYGFFNHTDVYESFLKGVKEGFYIVIEIAPTMIALLVSIGIFRASGALDSFSDFLTPLGKVLHIPAEIIPVFIVRIFSSSAAVSFVLDIFKEYGSDSKTGMIVSIMMSCTETVIYTITIYYMSINIKKNKMDFTGSNVCNNSRSNCKCDNHRVCNSIIKTDKTQKV